MNVMESMSNYFKIIIMLFVVMFSFSFFGNSLLQDAGFGYDNEKLIDKDYVYNKNIDIQNNQMSTFNLGEYEISLVSSQLVSVGPEALNPNNILANQNITLREYSVPVGSRPHDVVRLSSMLYVTVMFSKNLLKDIVWYTAQASGELGKLNTTTGETSHIFLGEGSAPHGVIAGPDGAPWITDGGLNAIVQ